MATQFEMDLNEMLRSTLEELRAGETVTLRVTGLGEPKSAIRRRLREMGMTEAENVRLILRGDHV